MSEEYSNGYARGYEAGQQSVLKLAEQPAQQEPVAWMTKDGEIYKHECWPEYEARPLVFGDTSQPAQQDDAWKAEQKTLADEAVKCATEALANPNHPATMAAREYYGAAQQQEQESLEDLHNALQRIDTAAVGLPTFEVRHEGGLDAVTQNIVDAITALHTQPAQQEPWGACVYGRVFVGRLPEHARKFSEDEGVPIQWLYTSPPAQRKPLPDGIPSPDELEALSDGNSGMIFNTGFPTKLDRLACWLREYAAIEAAHGIKENT